MTPQAKFVFVLLGVAAVLMASNRLRFDIVAILVVLTLMLSGILSVGEALSGFGSSVVILVAALLIVGEMLDRTGVTRTVGDFILRRGGKSESKLLILIMASAALLGGVMSSTAIVAVFIPIVLRVAAEMSISARRLLLPMSYSALISGMLTLIGTTPNIVVHEELKHAGAAGFGFFSFTPIGLAVLVVAVAYILVAGRWLLPAGGEPEGGAVDARTLQELMEDFGISDRPYALRIGVGSRLIGRTIEEISLENEFGARVIGILRRRRHGADRITAPTGDTEVHAGDTLIVVGSDESRHRLVHELDMEPIELTERDRQRWRWELGGATVIIHPESRLIGKSLRESNFRTTYTLHVLGIHRANKLLEDWKDARFRAGDSLFVVGPWSRIDQLHTHSHDFVVTALPRDRAEVVMAYRKQPVALAILGVMVLLVLFNIVPLVAAAMLAALAAVMTRCLTMEEAYRSIHWSSIVLLAGMLPLADALQKTGGTDVVVTVMMNAVGEAGPLAILTAVFYLTAFIGLFLSNTASAVLMAPIAIFSAKALDVSPYPFAVSVIVASSAAFMTPISTPVVTLVVEPGRYRFFDFIKLGTPLLVLTWLVTLLLAPLIFPFESFEWPIDQAVPEQGTDQTVAGDEARLRSKL